MSGFFHDPSMFAPPYSDPTEPPACPCEDGEDCPTHGPVCDLCDGHGTVPARSCIPTARPDERLPCGKCDGDGHIEPEPDQPPPARGIPVTAADFAPHPTPRRTT